MSGPPISPEFPAAPPGPKEATPGLGARRGPQLAVVGSTFYGITIVLAGVAYEGGANAGAVLELRFLVTAAVLAAVVRLKRRSFAVPRRVRLPIAGVCLGMFSLAVGYLGAIVFIPVSLTVLIFYTYPLLVAGTAPLIGKTRPTRAQIVAFPVAFAGLVLALGASFDILNWQGVSLAILAAVSAAYVFIVSPRAVAEYDVFGISFYMGLSNAVLMVPVIIAIGGIELPATPSGWAGMIGVSVFFVCAVMAMFAALEAIDATTTALVFNLEPVVAIAGAVVLLGERLSPVQTAGVALVIGALMLATLGRGRVAASAAAANDSESPGSPRP